jgi:signal transduction histidine kinase
LLAYAGKGGFAVSTLDISAAVSDMVRVLRPSVPETIQLEVELPEHLPAIEADVRQVQQLAYNLLINAVEAVEGHGVVRVATGRVRLDHAIDAVPRQLNPGEYVFFQVEDTGTGMNEHVKTRMFDPFFTTKFTGRGLGLAAVSGIVRAHHGGLQLMTAPGQGSTFRVLFPVALASRERPLSRKCASTPRSDE